MASASRNAFRNATRLWVGNLPWTVSKHELKAYFSQFGKVIDANVAYKQENLISRGFGFVTFQKQQTIDDVMAKGNHILEGREIMIKNKIND